MAATKGKRVYSSRTSLSRASKKRDEWAHLANLAKKGTFGHFQQPHSPKVKANFNNLLHISIVLGLKNTDYRYCQKKINRLKRRQM